MFPKKFKPLPKNEKRHISSKNAEIVRNRDGSCIICRTSPIQEIHHVNFGLDSNYGPDRNEPHELVGLCHECHHKLHFVGGNDYREFCKNYLKDLT